MIIELQAELSKGRPKTSVIEGNKLLPSTTDDIRSINRLVHHYKLQYNVIMQMTPIKRLLTLDFNRISKRDGLDLIIDI